ncbi:MAG: hypothetical protein HYY46_26345 [Deltaproteobacteria bacterium]|nr:hypothetical protein [Deltaproteobacteria bacterium]
MTEIERLEKAILDLHGCKGKHARSVPIHETFEGQTVWQGVVEVFNLENHPQAKIAYAWSYKGDDAKTHYVAVLGVPPVNSAEDAVRSYVVSESRKQFRPS